MPIKVKCAWCGRDMGEVEGEAREDTDVTHGICPDCDRVLRAPHKRATPEPEEKDEPG